MLGGRPQPGDEHQDYRGQAGCVVQFNRLVDKI